MQEEQQTAHLGGIFAVYLCGLLIGGLYMGMIAPVRTVIQAGFGIGDADGIWIINIYTLFYAAAIPVIGKVADRHGRKSVFVGCVLIFCAGSCLCAAAQGVGGFPLLLAGRVVQAVGAGGMIPVANAEIATTFPLEKRGAALGIAAATSGIANVLGAAVGSALISIAGTQNWTLMFVIALPLCVALAVAASVLVPRRAGHAAGSMDVAGAALFALSVIMLLLGITHLQFNDLAGSIAQPLAWGPLVVAVACAIVFGQVERRAADPVFHMEYLHSRPIVITMAVSFFIGGVMISMMLVPQFAEYAMGDPLGSGGYYILAIGVTAMVGPPVGGRLIDRFGPKPVLICGLGIMAAGYLFLAYAVAPHPSALLLIVGLAVAGLGMGFAMGAPTNYMILENTREEDAASAVATITLVRQIGTSVAPAIFVGFLGSNAGLLGYQQMLACVAVFCLAGIVLMLFYHSPQN